jgi:hypothetical protein
MRRTNWLDGAVSSCAAAQEFPILWNQKINRRVHKSPTYSDPVMLGYYQFPIELCEKQPG